MILSGHWRKSYVSIIIFIKGSTTPSPYILISFRRFFFSANFPTQLHQPDSSSPSPQIMKRLVEPFLKIYFFFYLCFNHHQSALNCWVHSNCHFYRRSHSFFSLPRFRWVDPMALWCDEHGPTWTYFGAFYPNGLAMRFLSVSQNLKLKLLIYRVVSTNHIISLPSQTGIVILSLCPFMWFLFNSYCT